MQVTISRAHRHLLWNTCMDIFFKPFPIEYKWRKNCSYSWEQNIHDFYACETNQKFLMQRGTKILFSTQYKCNSSFHICGATLNQIFFLVVALGPISQLHLCDHFLLVETLLDLDQFWQRLKPFHNKESLSLSQPIAKCLVQIGLFVPMLWYRCISLSIEMLISLLSVTGKGSKERSF